MPVVLLALALLQLTAACTSDGREAAAAPLRLPVMAGAPAPLPMKGGDMDRDALCDSTEAQLGTDPNVIDSDGDSLPDVIELIAGYDPNDPTSPDLDQLAYLSARAGALSDFSVSTTFDGVGQGATGQLSALNGLNPSGLRADRYIVGGTAVSAVPSDNVRGIDMGQEHFGSVLGNTRLTFVLHFAYGTEPALDCAAALPFQYSVKGDTGGYAGSRVYLLIVSPDAHPVPEHFCLPVACL